MWRGISQVGKPLALEKPIGKWILIIFIIAITSRIRINWNEGTKIHLRNIFPFIAIRCNNQVATIRVTTSWSIQLFVVCCWFPTSIDWLCCPRCPPAKDRPRCWRWPSAGTDLACFLPQLKSRQSWRGPRVVLAGLTWDYYLNIMAANT